MNSLVLLDNFSFLLLRVGATLCALYSYSSYIYVQLSTEIVHSRGLLPEKIHNTHVFTHVSMVTAAAVSANQRPFTIVTNFVLVNFVTLNGVNLLRKY